MWDTWQHCVLKSSLRRMERRVARPGAGRRRMLNPELMRWQREGYGGAGYKLWRGRIHRAWGLHEGAGTENEGVKGVECCLSFLLDPLGRWRHYFLRYRGEAAYQGKEEIQFFSFTSHHYLNFSLFFSKAVIVISYLKTHLMKIKLHLYYWNRCYRTYVGLHKQINRCRLGKVAVRIQREKGCIMPSKTIQERLGVHPLMSVGPKIVCTKIKQVDHLTIFSFFENFACEHTKCNKTARSFVYKRT